MPTSPAVAVDQPAPAPVGMRRRGEDGLVEHILPIAGELAFGRDAGIEGMPPAAFAGDDHEIADLEGGRRADFERRHAEAAERLHQAEPRFEVVAQRVAREHAAIARRQPDRFRLGDQVANGEHKAARADEDPVAGSLRPQNPGGERVLRDGCAQAHNRAERAVEVEGHLLRLRLRRERYFPIELVTHAVGPSPARQNYPAPAAPWQGAHRTGRAVSGRSALTGARGRSGAACRRGCH